MGEPLAVQGLPNAPVLKIAGQAVLWAVQKPPAAPSRVRVSVYLYSALPPTSIQQKRSSLPTSPWRLKVWIPVPLTSDLPRISNHSPKKCEPSLPRVRKPLISDRWPCWVLLILSFALSPEL